MVGKAALESIPDWSFMSGIKILGVGVGHGSTPSQKPWFSLGSMNLSIFGN